MLLILFILPVLMVVFYRFFFFFLSNHVLSVWLSSSLSFFAVGIIMCFSRVKIRLDARLLPTILITAILVGYQWLFWSRDPAYQLSYHGLFHTTLVQEIQRGVIPPHNPTLAGMPINTQWHYHLLVAIVGTALSIPAPTAACVINSFALVGLIFLSYFFINNQGRRPLVFIVAMVVLFSSNAVDLFTSQKMWLGGDPRLISFFHKYLNFNAFPLGILNFLLVVLLLFRNDLALNKKENLLILGLGLMGVFLFHSVSVVYVYTFLFLWLGIKFFDTKNIPIQIFQTVALSSFISLTLVLPSWLALKEVKIALGGFTQNLKGLISIAPWIIALVTVQLLAKSKKILTQSQSLFFLTTCFFTLITLVLSLVDGNQYKGIFYAVLLWSLLFCKHILPKLKDIPTIAILAIFLVVVTVFHLKETGIYYSQQLEAQAGRFYFQQNKVKLLDQHGINQICDQMPSLNKQNVLLIHVPKQYNENYYSVLCPGVSFLSNDGEYQTGYESEVQHRKQRIQTILWDNDLEVVQRQLSSLTQIFDLVGVILEKEYLDEKYEERIHFFKSMSCVMEEKLSSKISILIFKGECYTEITLKSEKVEWFLKLNGIIHLDFIDRWV